MFKVVWKSFKYNRKNFLSFFMSEILSVAVIFMLIYIQEALSQVPGIKTEALQFAYQSELRKQLRIIIPCIILIMILVTGYSVKAYINTRIWDYKLFQLLGIRKKNLKVMIGLEYVISGMLACGFGILFGLIGTKIIKENIEDQVLSMYAKGMTTRDISAHLKDVYGVDASAEMISHMTDRILPIAKEWQNRPLERKYAIVFMDAVHFHVREDNRTVKKAVYVAIGVKLNGKREVLGMWVGGNESAKYWLSVLNEIKNRGVEDIMIVSVDGLTGFGDAIHAVFPQAEIQRCIVHQIRYSTKFISYKDLRPFMADLKLVYKADTEDLALTALDDLEEKWGKKYPASIGSWRNNWTQLSTYFKYPSEIRKLIYTTNSIENFNRQLRKVTKSKTIFPTDDALFKMLYLAMMDVTKKWTGKAWDWGLTLDQLCIYFGDRIQPEDID